MTIFDKERQDTHAGGSGCGCAAVTLASYVLPKLEKGEWKRVLFVPTGRLCLPSVSTRGRAYRGSLTELFWKAMHSIRKLKSKKIEGKMIKARRMSRVEKRKGETKWIM
mgnify:FL=1